MPCLSAISVLALIVVSTSILSGSELPRRAVELLHKLEKFESQQAKALKVEVGKKRAQVVDILKQEMQDLTKKGDLEGALAVKAQIEGLSGEVDLTAIKAPASAQETTRKGAERTSEESLIEKLETFEFEQAKELKGEFRKKRDQIADILQQELEALTKEGDLDGALAVKAELERLGGEIELAAIIKEPAPTQQQREKMPPEEAKQAFEEFLIGQTVLVNIENYLLEYHFDKQGGMTKVKKNVEDGSTDVRSYEWAVVGANEADVKHPDGAVEKFTFTSDTEAKKEFLRGETLRSTLTATLKQSE